MPTMRRKTIARFIVILTRALPPHCWRDAGTRGTDGLLGDMPGARIVEG
jgi:hypothetical protein